MRVCPECDFETEDTICPNDGRQTIPGVLLSGPQRIEKFIGTTLDNKYHIESRLGAGGYATVYRAKHMQMGGDVAVKIMQAANVSDPVAIKRFYLEAQNTHKLRHPNTIRVMDFGQTPSADLYLVMEYLPGLTVKDAVKEAGQLSGARVASILAQVLKSLGEAHAMGLVHRDIKADNIMLVEQFGEKDFVKVLDFGISRQSNSAHLTHASGTIGTPRNMAPEQWRGEKVDPRTDLYALGCTAYFMLTGDHAFKFGTDVSGSTEVVAYMNAHLSEHAEPVLRRAPGVCTPGLAKFVARLLAKKREHRPESAPAALAELLKVAGDQPDDAAVAAAAAVAGRRSTVRGQPIREPRPLDSTRMLDTVAPGGAAAEGDATQMLDLSIASQFKDIGDPNVEEVTRIAPEHSLHQVPPERRTPPSALRPRAVGTDVVPTNAQAAPKKSGGSKTALYAIAAFVVGAVAIVGVVLGSMGGDSSNKPGEVVAEGKAAKDKAAKSAHDKNEPDKAAKVEPDKAAKVEPDKAAKVEPDKVEPDKVEPDKVEPDKVEPAVDPAKVAAVKVEPAKVEPAVDPAKVEPAKVEPAKVEPAKVEPAAPAWKVALSSAPAGLVVALRSTGETLGRTPFEWVLTAEQQARLANGVLGLSFQHADGRSTTASVETSTFSGGVGSLGVKLAPAAKTKVATVKKATKKKKVASVKKKKKKKKKKKGKKGWGF